MGSALLFQGKKCFVSIILGPESLHSRVIWVWDNFAAADIRVFNTKSVLVIGFSLSNL